jgi:hypothetical protein
MSNAKFYPVPFNSEFILSGEDILGKEILIFDLMGREVYRGKVDSDNFIISGSSWKDGVYSVRLSDSNGLYFDGKIVKI